MTWTPADRAHLRSVVDAARRELREREPDQVPAKLRRVAASSARTLPPPLEKSLVGVMVEDAEFRSAVAARWDPPGIDPGTDAIAERFLADPTEAFTLARAASDHAEAVADAERIEALERRVVELEAMLAEAKDRAAAARTEHEGELVRRRDADRAAREGLVERVTAAERDVEKLTTRAAASEEELCRRDAEVAALAKTIEELRRRPTAKPDQPRSALPSPVPSDPTALARHLDRIERMARPYRRPGRPSGVGGEDTTVSLPSGVSPDAAEAIEALVDASVDLIVVDGYNLAGTLTSGPFHDRAGRERVAPLATMLRRRVGARVIVVYDAVDVDGRPGVKTDLGIEVVFAQERSADDEIVAIVAAGRARTVVVTNDRDLRERCGAVGALAVWSDAVVDWANR